jgi:hypothetical protein
LNPWKEIEQAEDRIRKVILILETQGPDCILEMMRGLKEKGYVFQKSG